MLSINERAHKCYLKCGFKDTGFSRDAIFLNGKYYNKLHMDILESEFDGDYIRNKNIWNKYRVAKITEILLLYVYGRGEMARYSWKS